jgi:hypothetical protein
VDQQAVENEGSVVYPSIANTVKLQATFTVRRHGQSASATGPQIDLNL